MVNFDNWILRRDKISDSIRDNKCVKCSVTDRSNFMTFEKAVEASKKFNCSGIGFAFDGCNFVGIDIDHRIDDNGNMNDMAKKLITQFKDTYIPSLNVFHCIGTKNRPSNNLKALKVTDGGTA